MRRMPFPEHASRKVAPMLEQIERQEPQEQLTVPQLEIAAPAPMAENDQRQRRRMVVALVLLLVALGLVLVKDRDFWFPATDATESEAVDDSNPVAEASGNATPASTPPVVARVRASKKKGHPAPVAASKSVIPEASATPVVTATRAALPPLRVDVVSGGDRHQFVRPGNPSVRVELQDGTSAQPVSGANQAGTELASAATAPVTNAGEHVQMSTDTRQALSRPVRPEYPLLARQMKVQGAVVLDARIGKDGRVQNLQVLGGPAILADAARAAVRQWQFKPYFQDGQPVETQARITVNFTISAE
jgi:TonB family protein